MHLHSAGKHHTGWDMGEELGNEELFETSFSVIIAELHFFN